jgi:prepilin-type N-terminal cleavage/methylation domain-containing protein
LRIVNYIHSIINRITICHSCESRNSGKHWIPPYQVRGGLSQARNDKKGNPMSPSPSRREGWGGGRGFTLIEIIIVIVILTIVSAIMIKFLFDGLRIYTMTVNQKTLLDEGKLSLERMCRDIRDAQSISVPAAGGSGNVITFIRNNATAQDGASETITFQRNAGNSTLEKVKTAPAATRTMADNVNTFTVTRGAVATNNLNEIILTLNLLNLSPMASGENATLQTRVYPKNLLEDTSATPIYKNFRILNSAGTPIVPTWEEVRSP